MAFGQQTISDVGGAVQDIFGGIAGGQRADGYRAEAKGFFEASDIATKNVGLEEVATKLAQVQEERKSLKVIGGQMSDVAGFGFTNSGTALDLLADSNRQSALEQQITGVQGQIQENTFESQAESFRAQGEAAIDAAKAADTGAMGSFIGAGLKGLGAIATLL